MSYQPRPTNLPPVTLPDGTRVPGYLAAKMERDRANPPLRAVPQRSDDECVECGATVPSEFEPDPDPDGTGGVLILESSCPMCGVALCETCKRQDDDGYCPACTAEADLTPRVENVRAGQKPIPYQPEPE